MLTQVATRARSSGTDFKFTSLDFKSLLLLHLECVAVLPACREATTLHSVESTLHQCQGSLRVKCSGSSQFLIPSLYYALRATHLECVAVLPGALARREATALTAAGATEL